MPPFRTYEHLLRLAALFAAGVALFLGLRVLLVPADYGRTGPYRAGAVAENRNRPIVFAGQAACVECHGDVAEVRRSNAHASISCESCHGALAAHAGDPSVAAPRPGPRATCAICHLPDPAKPRQFSTVDFADHAGDEPCTTCHAAHAPRP
jgi:hypothetical protein